MRDFEFKFQVTICYTKKKIHIKYNKTKIKPIQFEHFKCQSIV